MTSYLKAYAEHRQVLSHEKALKLGGLLERGERVGLMFIVLVIALFSSVYASYLIFIIFIFIFFAVLALKIGINAVKGTINWDISPHIKLKSYFLLHHSHPYETQQIGVSFVYFF